MQNNIYLALYKGRKTGRTPTALLARFSDWATRKLTKGAYSHCEIVVERYSYSGGKYNVHRVYDCYSSSIRDGGVRCKRMNVQDGKWDLLPLSNITEDAVIDFFRRTQGKKYDWLGAFGVVFKSPQRRSRYFCSEWCGELLGLKESWRFSPNDLAIIFNK